MYIDSVSDLPEFYRIQSESVSKLTTLIFNKNLLEFKIPDQISGVSVSTTITVTKSKYMLKKLASWLLRIPLKFD